LKGGRDFGQPTIYEQAEGAAYRDRIALASGLTVPEAHAAGMLPYQIIAALRKNDPVVGSPGCAAFRKLSPELMKWVHQHFSEEEFAAGLRELRETGGLEFQDFFRELEQESAPRD
jgi:hypothetical protein